MVWHFCGATNTKKLERIQFRALRFVFLDFESDYATLLDRAGLPTLELSRKRAILIDIFKNLMHQSPAFMWNSYKPKHINYNLRNTNKLCIPHSKTTRYGLQTLTASMVPSYGILFRTTLNLVQISIILNLPLRHGRNHDAMQNVSTVSRLFIMFLSVFYLCSYYQMLTMLILNNVFTLIYNLFITYIFFLGHCYTVG